MIQSTMTRAALAAVCVLPLSLGAQKPTAQAIFDKHAAAVGGVAAFRAAPTRTEIGTADITFAGMTATYERKISAGKMLMTLELGGMGQVVQGFDGNVLWAINPGAGAQKMDANMSAEAAVGIAPTGGLWEPGSYASATVLDAAQFEGTLTWPVTITTKTGQSRTVYYDQATGMKVGEMATVPGSGAMKIVYADYKPFGAIKVATKVTQGTPQGDVVITITAVKFDAIDASVFALPDAVKALP
jgi:hypothetical protein